MPWWVHQQSKQCHCRHVAGSGPSADSSSSNDVPPWQSPILCWTKETDHLAAVPVAPLPVAAVPALIFKRTTTQVTHPRGQVDTLQQMHPHH